MPSVNGSPVMSTNRTISGMKKLLRRMDPELRDIVLKEEQEIDMNSIDNEKKFVKDESYSPVKEKAK